MVEFIRGEGRVGRVEGEGVDASFEMVGLGMGDVQFELMTETDELCV